VSLLRRHEAAILGGASVLVVVAVWELAWQAGWISPLFFSGPSAVAARFREDWSHGTLPADIAYSGRNFALGFSLATAAGVVLGVRVGWYRRLRLVVEPFVTAFFATPRIAIVPLVILWFGIGLWSKVFVVFVSAFFPILVNTIAGVKALDADLLRAARSFCASDRQIFTTVAIPGSVPFILTGVRQGVAHGLIGVVVGEMFAGSQGIGFMIAYGGQTFATDTLFVGVAIIAFAGILLTWMAERLQRHFSRWRPSR